MANLGGTFDATAVPEREDFDVLPAGEYQAQMIESDVVATKAGTGQMIKATWEILTGPYASRKVWQNINIQNQNAKAAEIGQQQLAEIVRACGLVTVNDTEDLHWKPCVIRLSVKQDAEYGPRNEVKKVKPMGATAAPAQATGKAPPPAARANGGPPATTGNAPWR